MIFNNLIQLWRKIVEVKKSKTANKAGKDFLSVELIPVELDSLDAAETKAAAQKILSMMFASLHKRGRPSQKEEEELSYAI